ncbi:MAG: hypothetical protein ACE5I1_15860 [bacterium]
MWQDPIVEEIREIRRKIEAECQDDFDKIFAQAMAFQKKFALRTVSKPGLNREPKLTAVQAV